MENNQEQKPGMSSIESKRQISAEELERIKKDAHKKFPITLDHTLMEALREGYITGASEYLHAHSSQASGQLRWVKANERQPTNGYRVIIRYINSKMIIDKLDFCQLKKGEYHQIEWLEELSQPIKEPVVEMEKNQFGRGEVKNIINQYQDAIVKQLWDGKPIFTPDEWFDRVYPSPPSIQQEAILESEQQIDESEGEENDDPYVMCYVCNGSGEGPADRTTCRQCKGEGRILKIKPERNDYE